MVLRRPREFDAIKVGRCHVQTAKDRYAVDPAALNQHVAEQVDTYTEYEEDNQDGFQELDSDEETDASQDPGAASLLGHTFDHEHAEFDPNFQPALPMDMGRRLVPPRTALWRMNLTGLSQRYNLYFVAYEGDVHVYRPRDAVRNTLPTRPDYILKSDPVGPNFSGDIVHDKGHQVNNVVVGDLGDDEVLALAFDDGNAIAYNVNMIANYIAALEHDPRTWAGRPPQPFFHQSVGISAWGLALHKTSRLIAVSCNYRTITVFCPALCVDPSNPSDGEENDDGYYDFPDIQVPEYPSPELASIQCEHSMLKHNSHRQRNYRMIFAPPREASNIPSIAFTSMADGTADKVVGIDLAGSIWVFSVWGDKRPIQCLPYNHVSPEEELSCRGWGILLLPTSSFLPVSDRKEAFGAKLETDIAALGSQPAVGWDISSTIRHIPDNVLGPSLRLNREVGPINTNSNHEDGANNNINDALLLPMHPAVFTSAPHLARSSKRPRQSFGLGSGIHGSRSENKYSVFRVGTQKMELHSLRPDAHGVLAIGVLQPTPHLQQWTDEKRMNTLLHIPELSLAVVGTMQGYVALIRLTQTPPAEAQRGFRVEWTLPRRSDTMNRALAPLRPFAGPPSSTWYLHGITASPVPESRPQSQSHLPHRRFRLILHYRNHVILSYELSRDTQTEDLLVF